MTGCVWAFALIIGSIFMLSAFFRYWPDGVWDLTPWVSISCFTGPGQFSLA